MCKNILTMKMPEMNINIEASTTSFRILRLASLNNGDLTLPLTLTQENQTFTVPNNR